MPKPIFQIHREYGDEGELNFYVNGHHVGACNHDTHGWEGMDYQKRMFESIAQTLGVEVQEVE